MHQITVEHVTPRAGVCGGRLTVVASGLDPQALATCLLAFGTRQTRPLLTTPTCVVGTVPDNAMSATMQLVQGDQLSNALPFVVATRVADNLHPVANPAIDHAGNIYTTISGTKGHQVPVSLYRLTPAGDLEPFASGVVNPTGLAFGPDRALYVSSRHQGKIYRVDHAGAVSPFAEGLGIATGLAFDQYGDLYVGDRRGMIYRVSEQGAAQRFAQLSPSVASYHLAFGDDACLYVSYPTFTGDDRIYRLTPAGTVQEVAQGLGRSQGLAFDHQGNLYVVAHFEGVGGILRITPTGDVQHLVAGVNLVGLAFSADGELIVADNSALYRLDLGLQGRPLW